MSRHVANTGRLPDWMDAERSGWPFREASMVYAQPEIHRMIEIENRFNPIDGGVSFPRPSDYPQPPTRSEWWAGTDIHTPIIVGRLIRGELVAFGDPENSGASPEWIAARQWMDLACAPETPWIFEGGGRRYWNVRVLTAQEVEQFQVVAERGSEESENIENVKTKNKGGRPTSNTIFPFFGELIRLANSLDGLPESSTEIKTHMSHWATQAFSEGGPSDSTIASWLRQAGLK